MREIASPSRESAAWDLAERVAGRDLRGAMDVFRHLMFQREEPIWLINLVEARFREMAVLRDARERGWVRPAGRLVRCILGPGAAPPHAAVDEGALWYAEHGAQVRLQWCPAPPPGTPAAMIVGEAAPPGAPFRPDA